MKRGEGVKSGGGVVIAEGLFGWSEILCWGLSCTGGGGRVCWKERFGKKARAVSVMYVLPFLAANNNRKQVVIF